MVDVPGPAILGLATCQALHAVTLHCELSNTTPQSQPINNISELIRQYPQQFDQIGELPTTHTLVVDPNVPSRIDPPRRTPIALKDKIKVSASFGEFQRVSAKPSTHSRKPSTPAGFVCPRGASVAPRDASVAASDAT